MIGLNKNKSPTIVSIIIDIIEQKMISVKSFENNRYNSGNAECCDEVALLWRSEALIEHNDESFAVIKWMKFISCNNVSYSYKAHEALLWTNESNYLMHPILGYGCFTSCLFMDAIIIVSANISRYAAFGELHLVIMKT